MTITKVIRKGNGIQKTVDALANPKPFLEQAGEIISANWTARILFTKMGPDEKPWAPWAKATLFGRMKKGNAALGLLHDNGDLARSIKHVVEGKHVTVGSDAGKYAEYLQLGTNNMPARPFIGFSKKDRGELRKALIEHLRKETK